MTFKYWETAIGVHIIHPAVTKNQSVIMSLKLVNISLWTVLISYILFVYKCNIWWVTKTFSSLVSLRTAGFKGFYTLRRRLMSFYLYTSIKRYLKNILYPLRFVSKCFVWKLSQPFQTKRNWVCNFQSVLFSLFKIDL